MTQHDGGTREDAGRWHMAEAHVRRWWEEAAPKVQALAQGLQGLVQPHTLGERVDRLKEGLERLQSEVDALSSEGALFTCRADLEEVRAENVRLLKMLAEQRQTIAYAEKKLEMLSAARRGWARGNVAVGQLAIWQAMNDARRVGLHPISTTQAGFRPTEPEDTWRDSQRAAGERLRSVQRLMTDIHRASGDAVCAVCELPYRLHPRRFETGPVGAEGRDNDVIACDGRRLHL